MKSFLTLSNPVDYSLSGVSIHGILEARLLGCVPVQCKMVTVLLPFLEAQKDFSPVFSTGTCMSFQRQTTQYCSPLPTTGSLWSFKLQLIRLGLQYFVNQRSDFPTLTLALKVVFTALILLFQLPVCLSSHSDLSCVLHFGIQEELFIIFQSIQLFTCYQSAVAIPKLVICGIRSFQTTEYGNSTFVGLSVFTIFFSILELDLLNINDIQITLKFSMSLVLCESFFMNEV